ncbi:hypothetical protein M231_05276 [Tremella mesenterica]|uniref:Uncharacterized protein n=1 Tax=Tremella mesenterica TaxID=5217 RepID=A0A4Q1BIG7_TREME|nr:hypothetical protein M231_05276 [Tremella mesenterica]
MDEARQKALRLSEASESRHVLNSSLYPLIKIATGMVYTFEKELSRGLNSDDDFYRMVARSRGLEEDLETCCALLKQPSPSMQVSTAQFEPNGSGSSPSSWGKAAARDLRTALIKIVVESSGREVDEAGIRKACQLTDAASVVFQRAFHFAASGKYRDLVASVRAARLGVGMGDKAYSLWVLSEVERRLRHRDSPSLNVTNAQAFLSPSEHYNAGLPSPTGSDGGSDGDIEDSDCDED